jgi:hypothetical protein
VTANLIRFMTSIRGRTVTAIATNNGSVKVDYFRPSW